MLLTVLSTAGLIAPSAHHRMRFRDRAKAAIVKVGNVCTVLGLAFLAGAVGMSLHLVINGTAVLWFLVPRLLPRD